MFGKVDFNVIKSPATQNNTGQNQGIQGLGPAFFGPPNPADRMKDMQACKSLGIDPQGMDRLDVKASILSKLTGKPADQMKEFYSSVGEQDMRKDLHALKSFGEQPSNNPDNMKARAENKAMIANNWIQGNDGQQANGTDRPQQTGKPQQAKGKQGGGKCGGPPPLSSAVKAIFDAAGVSPSGDKNGDYTSVMNALRTMSANTQDFSQKQYLDSLQQTFKSLFSV